MKFLFIQPEFENIGIEYVSASLKKAGHETSLVYIPRPFQNSAFSILKEDEQRENINIGNAIRKIKPEVVCFSPFTSYFRWSVNKSDYIKKYFPSIFILYGGIHPTFIPEATIIENSVDALIVGDGEEAVVDFADNFHDWDKLKTVQNLWIKKDGKVIKNPLRPKMTNLDNLPFPDKDLFFEQFPKFQKKVFGVVASRGCPYKCTYCCNNVYNELYKGQKILSFQSPEYVIEQLKYFKCKYNYSLLEFMDDVLAVKMDRLEALLPAFKQQIGVPFTCFMYPNKFTGREDVIKILKETGCSWLKIGVQTSNERYRKEVLKRTGTNELIIKIADLCNKYNLNFSFDHIFDMPGETAEDLYDAAKLYNRCRPTIVHFGTLMYLPKTKIINEGLKVGALKTQDVALIDKGEEPAALSSNVGRFARHSGSEKVNNSIFVFLFIAATIFPKRLMDFLLKYEGWKTSKFQVPQFILIMMKIASKIKAKQGYVYFSAVRYTAYYTLKRIKEKFSRDKN